MTENKFRKLHEEDFERMDHVVDILRDTRDWAVGELHFELAGVAVEAIELVKQLILRMREAQGIRISIYVARNPNWVLFDFEVTDVIARSADYLAKAFASLRQRIARTRSPQELYEEFWIAAEVPWFDETKSDGLKMARDYISEHLDTWIGDSAGIKQCVGQVCDDTDGVGDKKGVNRDARDT